MIQLVSYGHRYGPPPHLTETFDARTLPNPPRAARRGLTGLSPRLRTEVLKSTAAQQLCTRIVERIVEVHEASTHQVISVENISGQATQRETEAMLFGVRCECGRHRSPAVAEEVTRQLRAMGLPVVEARHWSLENRQPRKQKRKRRREDAT